MSVEEVKLLTQDVLMIPNGFLIHETWISESDKRDKNQKGT